MKRPHVVPELQIVDQPSEIALKRGVMSDIEARQGRGEPEIGLGELVANDES
jgi:hypothetical protein